MEGFIKYDDSKSEKISSSSSSSSSIYNPQKVAGKPYKINGGASGMTVTSWPP
jgi:hypothetical protein